MILRNPTDSDLKVKIFGTEYLMEAGKEMRLKDEAAIFWRKNLHQFLEVVEEKKVPVKEDVKEEVIEKPKKK